MMKVIKTIAIGILLALLLYYALDFSNTVEEIPIELPPSAQNSIMVDKVGNLYIINYDKDYHFDEFLKVGAESDEEMIAYLEKEQLNPYSGMLQLIKRVFFPLCSSYSAENANEEYVFGRNLDYVNEDTAVFLFTHPEDGYASVAMVDGTFFGVKEESFVLDNLASVPYFPFDGMNEYGLAIGMNSAGARSIKDPNKKTIGPGNAIRLMLDYAKNVDEAIELLKEYNIYFHAEPVNFMISDATGRSVIVGFVGENIEVTENDAPWQILTNFRVASFPDANEAVRGGARYKAVYNGLKKNDWKASEPMNLLKRVVQSGNWSVVYNKTTGEVKIVVRKQFNKQYVFQMKMRE
jgi:hypothetical protein